MLPSKMKTSTAFGTAAIVAGILVFSAGSWVYQRSFGAFEEPPVEREHYVGQKIHPVIIQGKPETPTALTSQKSHHGKYAEISCTTCHTTRKPLALNRDSDDLDIFHQGLEVQHGNLTCLSCHNRDNYDTLKLSDGTPVHFKDTMKLCGQCHGPQYRDYTNGSHGGMNGYWDLSRGPRTRNACTVCHDAHAPAYPQFMPVFPPKDLPAQHPASQSSH